jgi:hypothetical protein
VWKVPVTYDTAACPAPAPALLARSRGPKPRAIEMSCSEDVQDSRGLFVLDVSRLHLEVSLSWALPGHDAHERSCTHSVSITAASNNSPASYLIRVASLRICCMKGYSRSAADSTTCCLLVTLQMVCLIPACRHLASGTILEAFDSG